MQTLARCVMNVAFATTLAILGPSVISLDAQSATPIQRAKAEPSTTLTLTVGGVSKQFSRNDLLQMPQSNVTVHNGHTNRDENYRGVALADLLGTVGLPFSKDTQRTFLHSYVRAQGTDFYFVLYSAAEIEPELSGNRALVATSLDGHSLGDEGEFKLVSVEDKRPARWVRNLLSLTLVTLN